MKPVDKGSAPRLYTNYGEAKPHLIDRLGSHCSYCEAFCAPTALDVEHIYPKGAHPTRENDWDNFLISCKSCNSKKNSFLGAGRQRSLHHRFLWPHLDNTARAFKYVSDGSVAPAAGLDAGVDAMARRTMDMVGAMISPAKAIGFEQLAIAYTAASRREEVWRQAQEVRGDYIASPSTSRAQLFARLSAQIGYFSIWMEVFADRPEFKRELISAFKADPACYDQACNPVARGRV